MRDVYGHSATVLEASSDYTFVRDPNGANLEAASAEIVAQEPGYIGTFSTKTPNGNGFDLAYAKYVDGEPSLVVVEDKSGLKTSKLTAFGEGSNGALQLQRNSQVLVDSINNADLPDTGQTHFSSATP